MFTLIISRYNDNIHESDDLRICEFKSYEERDNILLQELDPYIDIVFNFDSMIDAENTCFKYRLNRTKEYTKIMRNLFKINKLPINIPENCRSLFVHLDDVITPFPGIYRISLNILLLLTVNYKQNIKLPTSKTVKDIQNLNEVIIYHNDVLNKIPNLLNNDINNIFNMII